MLLCVCCRQKARLCRLQQSKLAARRAIAVATRRFDEWQRRCGARTADVSSTLTVRRDAVVSRPSMDGFAGPPLDKKDLFEFQHSHLLRCLEYTTVKVRFFTFMNDICRTEFAKVFHSCYQCMNGTLYVRTCP